MHRNYSCELSICTKFGPRREITLFTCSGIWYHIWKDNWHLFHQLHSQITHVPVLQLKLYLAVEKWLNILIAISKGTPKTYKRSLCVNPFQRYIVATNCAISSHEMTQYLCCFRYNIVVFAIVVKFMSAHVFRNFGGEGSKAAEFVAFSTRHSRLDCTLSVRRVAYLCWKFICRTWTH